MNLYAANTPGLPHELPFYDKCPTDPTIEEMHELVCVQVQRPTALPQWATHEVS